MPAQAQLEPGYVLHRRPWRETSLLLEVLTARHGRLGLVARGARRSRGGGSQAGLLQPFVPLLLSWSGRGELATLTGVEAAGRTAWLRGRGLLAALYVNELLMRLLAREDPHPEVHEAYAWVLARLTGPEAGEAPLRIFEKRLLEALGYGLVLEHEADAGAPVRPEALYTYHADRGPMAAGVAEGDGLPVQGATLLALAREALDDPRALREAKALMRAALQPHLGERPLATRALFR